LIQYWDRI